jgi:N-acetylneuraminic acid mutarotase
VSNAIYILGGVEEDREGINETVSSVLKFDCQMQTWSEVAPMPEERDTSGACVVGSDIFVFGGNAEIGARTSSTYRFNTETNKWATLASMPKTLSQHSVSVLDGLIYVMGGEDEDEISLSSVHRFDPVANMWSMVAPMSVARSMCGSFVLGGSIYAVGGTDGRKELSSMERYSVALDSWSMVHGGEMGTARDCFGALVVRLEADLFDNLIAKAKNESL